LNPAVDTYPDIAVANRGSGDVSVLFGNGSGGFSAPTNFAADTAPGAVAIGDLNGDTKPDLAIANSSGTGGVSVLAGNGTGGFSAPANFATGGRGSYSLVIGDVDGDAKPDLAVANANPNLGSTGGTVSILLGDGTGGFSPASVFPSNDYDPLSLASGDLNGDTKPDLAV